MTKDILFLLGPDFDDGGAPWYCRECAEVRGLLAYYPQLADRIEVRTMAYPRPRAAMVELLGDAHQNCPTLVIASGEQEPPADLAVKTANGRRFVDDAKTIGEYLAAAYGIGRPHP
jgi:hypothetical protein